MTAIWTAIRSIFSHLHVPFDLNSWHEDLIYNNLKFFRVVLMSATADISRYREYFRDLGRGDRVEVLAIPSSNQKSFFQCSVTYLEQASLWISLELNFITGLTNG